MSEAIFVVALVVGVPIFGGCLIAVTAILRSWWIKGRELKLKEQQLCMEDKLRTDEMNARILRMDDFGTSVAEINQLAEDVRQLRQEVAQLRQEQSGRGIG